MRPRPRPRLRSLLALALALSLGHALEPAVRNAWAGDAVASERYRDKNWKFSFLKIKEWAQVPLETKGTERRDLAEDCLVARFAEVSASRAPGILRVFRMVNGVAAGQPAITEEKPSAPPPPPPSNPGQPPVPPVPPAPPAPPAPNPPAGPTPPAPPGRPGPKGPKNMTELLESQLNRMQPDMRLFATSAKEIKSKDGVVGKMWLLDAEHGAFFAVAIWAKEGVEVGMYVGCETQVRKKFESAFVTTLRSFRWFDDHADDVDALPQLEGLRLSARKRREIETGLVAGWSVEVSPKKNYVVVYNTKGRTNTPLARMIAERIEEIRAQVYEVQFPPSRPVDAVSIVRLCGDAAEYHRYGGPGGSAGYWNDDSEELVFYDASPKREADDNTLAVLYHEAFHQYIYYSVGKVAPHSWFNEGHGDYYAGARYVDKKFVIRPFAWRVPVVKAAITAGPCPFETSENKRGETVRKWDRKNRGYSPLAQLVDMDQREYYEYPSVCYAQGWSLVYFLREIVPKNPKWNAKWGKILATYFDTLKAEVKKAEAEEAAAAAAAAEKAKAKAKPPAPATPTPTSPTPPAPGPAPTSPTSPAAPTSPPPAGPAPTPPPVPTPVPFDPTGGVAPVPGPSEPAPATPAAPQAPTPATPPVPAPTPAPTPAPVAPLSPDDPTPPPLPPPTLPVPAPPTPPAPVPAPTPSPTPPTPPAPPTPPTDAPTPPVAPPTAPAPTPPAPPPPVPTPPVPPADPSGDGTPPDVGIAMPDSREQTSEKVLRAALKAAFEGVNFAELELAWKETISKVSMKK